MEIEITNKLFSGELNFECPNCGGGVVVNESEINCGIFRHAVYKLDNQQIPPHLSKNECEILIMSDKINGCGMPYEIVKINNKWYVRICDYI